MEKIIVDIKWLWWICVVIGNIIGGSVIAGIIIQKYKSTLNKLKEIIVDEKSGTIKVVSIGDCKEQIENCGRHRMDRRKEDKETVANELAKLTKKLDAQCKEITEMRKQIAGMSATIVKELRSMGILK